ncbi:MAG: L-lactate dehydrogenase [Patescibacteria group bacterium]
MFNYKSPDNNKVSIIGCGKVGMTAAYSIVQSGLVNELVLVGRNKKALDGEKLDLDHGASFLKHTDVIATDNYEDIRYSDVVIITAGAGQKPGETRLDLTKKNLAIIEDIIPKIVKYSPNSVILIVSNPVDILTYHAYKLAQFPKGQIFGSGTTLDTSRFRYHLSQFLDVSPQSIHAYVLGEHGDSSFPVIANSTVGGQPLNAFENFSEQKALEAFEKTKNAAYKIIQAKGATYYAIGIIINHIVEAILRDTKEVLPLSIPLHGYYDHYGVALSVPCVVGKRGVERILQVKLSWEEKQMLAKSVETLKKYL